MELLLFLALLFIVCTLAYVWGPDDTRDKRFSAREKSALSVAAGLGFAIPILAQTYDSVYVMTLGVVLVSLFTASVAGRRPLLHAYIANAVILEWWFVLRFLKTGLSGNDVLTLISGSIAILAMACTFLMVLSTILYPIWHRRRKNDAQKRKAAQSVALPGTTTQGAPAPVNHVYQVTPTPQPPQQHYVRRK